MSNTAERENNPNHSGERFKDISELLETTPGRCNFRELGPPDLVHVIKSTQSGKSLREFSSYHFVMGVDTSSSASIAAYVNSLTYSLEKSVGWLRNNPWKITRSTYCCYNAFSGHDIRVEARIPGGVTAYAIAANGTKIVATAEMWLETYVCSMLRGIQSDCNYPALRKLDPLPTELMEKRFLETCGKLFFGSWQLGSVFGHLSGTAINNFMVSSILKYFSGCQRPQIARSFFEPFVHREPDIISLIARCLFLEDNEPGAITKLYETIVAHPDTVSILLLQSEFLTKKKRYVEALQIAKEAVRASPIDYLVWTTLSKAQINCEEYDAALISLNTCPLTLPLEIELWKIAPGTKLWSPCKEDAPIDIIGTNFAKDSILERLKGATLRGAVKVVYDILAKLESAIGWDELLKLRSNIFLMEEEYKSQTSKNSNNVTIMMEKTTIGEDSMEQIPLNDHPISNSQKQAKRMCERWLDSLFMILFEDLRVYTLFHTELQKSRNENINYQRTARDWLLLGDLSRRLDRMDDAKEAYHRCVEMGFSRSAWTSLLEIYAGQGKLSHALNAASKLLVYDDSHFCNLIYTSTVAEMMYKLVKDHGLDRIKTTMITLNLGGKVEALVQKFIDAANNHKSIGYDY